MAPPAKPEVPATKSSAAPAVAPAAPAAVAPANGAPAPAPAARRRRASKARAKVWYEDNLKKHLRATEALRLLLQNLLEQSRVPLVSVTSRTKGLTNYIDKAVSKKDGKRRYRDPAKEILDVCGLRVVTYFDSTTKKVDAVIRDEFLIDEANSMDKTKDLGVDRVGYRSVHYIARLKDPRSKLAEYGDFGEMPFEIQVRSILQHAWAEIEHDRRFKLGTNKALPDELQRRFSLLAGGLEILDRDFDLLALDVDQYNKAIVEAPPQSAVQTTPLTLPLISSYLSGAFSFEIDLELLEPSIAETILPELRAFGVETLEQLRELAPADLDRKHSWAIHETTFTGLLRNAMLIKDHKRYLETAWQKDFTEISFRVAAGLNKTANVPFGTLDSYGLTVYVNEDWAAANEEPEEPDPNEDFGDDNYNGEEEPYADEPGPWDDEPESGP